MSSDDTLSRPLVSQKRARGSCQVTVEVEMPRGLEAKLLGPDQAPRLPPYTPGSFFSLRSENDWDPLLGLSHT